jgi:VIT1/CCC1 family predicted Fe2+/Mn2+ transporter
MSSESRETTGQDASRVIIFDTTLRDGEQSPGCSMNLEEKLQVAEVLQELKVDVIEAGFPIASNGDFEAVSEVSRRIKGCSVAALARARERDIDRAWEAVQHAARPRIHTFLSTSPPMRATCAPMSNGRPRTGPVPSMISCAAVSNRRSRRGPRRSISPIRWAIRCPRNSTP